MADERYKIEVRPLMFRLMDGVVKYIKTRAGFTDEEIERAVDDWLIRRRSARRI